MRHCRWFALFGCLFLLAAPARAADSKTTRQLLTKYTEDLTNLWKEYASDKHKDTRDRAIQDYQQTFQREVANAEVPAGLKVNAITQTFIENMANSATLFRLEKMNTTRTAYLQGCVQAFKREYAKASDYAEPRTTQKVFELTMPLLTIPNTPITVQTESVIVHVKMKAASVEVFALPASGKDEKKNKKN
ncbi:MAG TPA: hypothetical protein VEJ63_20000, partial [Planctomycetota bacterium]|nr:hypothetical protein [Planctomycetota bacterium]